MLRKFSNPPLKSKYSHHGPHTAVGCHNSQINGIKKEKTPVCIGCLCLHILCLFAIGYNKRPIILWERGGVYFIFLGIKNGVDFYEKLDNKNKFF